MSVSPAVPSYPESTARGAVGPATPCGSGEPADGLDNLRSEAPHSLSSEAVRGSGPRAGAPAEGREPRSGSTELVLEGRLEPTTPEGVGWSLRDDECPLEGAVSIDRTTGEVAWRPTCKSARCRRCTRQVSAQTFALARRALEPIEHVRFITLTQAPAGWEPTRHAVKMWHRHLRRQGFAMNTLTVVEEGSETGMKHVHAVQWGDFIPKSVLDESWPYGWNEIEGARAATNYLAKGVVRYVAKGLDGDGEAVEEHMNLNGGRAAHWTRGFFGGLSREAYRQASPLPGIYFVETVR